MSPRHATDADKPPVSAYIRTFNEEHNITRTVRALRACVGEVIVVDSGSTDATVAIATAAGARVVQQQWLGKGHQKRVGEDACRHEWLLDIDADEVVSDELAREIRAVFSGGGPDADVYEVALTTVDPAGRVWHKAGVRYRAKLYDRRKIRMPAHGAWDQFDVTGAVRKRRLPGALLHYSFSDLHFLARKQAAAAHLALGSLPPRPRVVLLLRLCLLLPFYFFKRYVLRGLWRAGLYGLFFAVIGAFVYWLRDAMMYEQHYLNRDARDDGGPESGDPPKNRRA